VLENIADLVEERRFNQ